MKSRVIKHLTGAMALAASFIFSVSAVFGAWQPGLIQAKIKGTPSNNQMPAWQTDLLENVAPENLDVTAGTLMVDQNFGNTSAKTNNTFLGSNKSWSWDNNSTFAYEGQIYLEGGVTYWFWQQCDDGAAIMIDGEEVVSAGTSSGYNGGTAGFHTPTATGWYDLNIMAWDWSGGKGPHSGCYGIAYSTTVTAAPSVTKLSVGTEGWNFLQDDGTGTFLRHDDGTGFNEALIVSANLPSSVTQENPESFATRTTLEVGAVSISVPNEVYPIDDISRYHRVGYALMAYDDEAGDYVTPVATTMSDDGTTFSFNYAEGGRYQLVWNYDLEYRVQCSAADATLGTVEPAEAWVKEGGSVTVTATPNDAEAYYFLRWKDGTGKTYHGSPASITVTGPFTLSAVFWQVGAPVGIEVSSDDLVDGKLPLDTIVASLEDGDELIFADGEYNWVVNVEIKKGITLRSASGNPSNVVLQRSTEWKSLTINHANAVVKDLTIKGPQGGNSDPLINFPQNGAGGEIRNCVIEGGTTYTDGKSAVTLKGPGLISHCAIKNIKYVGGKSGSILIAHKDAVIRNCLIAGCSGNNANSAWGTVYITAGTLESCTIAGNAAKQYSGVYATGGLVRNCLVGGNTLSTKGVEAGNKNIQVYTDGNATFEYCVVPEPVAGSNIHVVEEPFADAEYRPALRTSIINAGSNQSWMETATDLAGNSRIVNDTVDIGAYESAEMPAMNPSGFIQIQGSDRGLPPFDVTFAAILENCGDPSAVHYEWNFGDGTTDSGTGKATVTHCYTSIGEHQVSLTVSNADAGVNNYALEKTVPVYVGSKTIYVAPEGSANVVSEWPYMTPETAATNLHMVIDWAFERSEVVMLKGTHFVNRNETIQLINGVVIRGETGKPEDVIYSYKEKKGWGNKFFEIINQGAVIRDMTLDVAPETAMTGSTYGRIAQLSAGMITNCVLRNGVATAERVGGGAVYLTDSGIVSHCVISNCVTGIFEDRDEKGHRGSAVVMTGGRLEECLITGNSTSSDVPSWSVAKTDRGAPVAIKGGEIVNCTIVNNSAYSCAGVYVMGTGGKVVNTIIANNVSEYTGEDAIATAAVWAGASANVFSRCFSDTLRINDNCLQGDPLFIDPVNGDYHLSASSPCVDAGTVENVTLSKVDLDGKRRVLRRKPDIGCYELRKYGLKIMLR